MTRRIFAIIVLLCLNVTAYSQDYSQYLILGDMGTYKPASGVEFMGKMVGGGSSSFQGGDAAGGYYTAYKITYAGAPGAQHPTVEVDVYDETQWLLHGVEEMFLKAGTLGAAYAAPNPARNIDGNTIYFLWGHYKWVSNNIVISIDTSDMTGAKSEPLEVLQAYLQKYPSTVPATLVLDDAHKVQWIKDEMARRLWLCDKWFMQLQLKKAEEREVYEQAVKSMSIFLDYREKYFSSFFSSFKAAPEKSLLEQFLSQNNGTGIRTKLKEYKDWWAGNKDKAISL